MENSLRSKRLHQLRSQRYRKRLREDRMHDKRQPIEQDESQAQDVPMEISRVYAADLSPFRRLSFEEDDDGEDDEPGGENNQNISPEEPDSTIRQLRQWALRSQVPHAHLDDLLKLLRKSVLPSLPATSKTFLETNKSNYSIENFINKKDCEFVYFGVAQQLKSIINTQIHLGSKIELLVNVDGSSPYNSSSKQFWPILGKVFFTSDIYKPFPIALYCGVGKPSNMESYFQYFVNEMNDLTQNGVDIDGLIFNISIKAFVCDRPARSIVKCIRHHGSIRACERCTVDGVRVERRTVYLSMDSENRTDAAFRRQLDILHHDGVSPLLLLEPPINMVNDFVLDSMHLAWLGIMKKLLIDTWINGDSRVKFSRHSKERFSEYLLTLKSQIPMEFQRSTASLTDVFKWKATQMRFLAAYAGPIILKNCLPENIYNHFLLFHVAIRILSSKDMALSCSTQASLYLRTFVRLCTEIYGEKFNVLNVHSLIHLADDIVNMQCTLSEIAAFPFESALHSIHKMLRTGYRPLSQICRRLHEKHFLEVKKAVLPEQLEILKKLRDSSGTITIKKMRYEECVLTNKFPNNTVLLSNNDIIEISRIFIMPNSSQVRLTGSSLQKIKSIFSNPCESSLLSMWKVSRSNSEVIECLVEDISHKMVCIDISHNNSERIYVMPLLHT